MQRCTFHRRLTDRDSRSSSPSPEHPTNAERCPAKIHRPPTPPAVFRFLELPGELQNRVADNFLVSESPITIHAPRFNRHPSRPPRARSRPRFDRHVPPTPPLSRTPSSDGFSSSSSSSSNSRAASRSTSRHPRRRRHQPDKEEELRQNLGHTRLALLMASRKLYDEHWTTYYGANTFAFEDIDVLEGFLDALPPRCRAEIRRLSVRMPHKHHHGRVWNRLARLQNLRELELVLYPPSLAEEREYEQALAGARECRALAAFAISRREEDEDKGGTDAEQDDQVLARDRQVEDQVNAYLRQRDDKRAAGESLPRAERQEGQG